MWASCRCFWINFIRIANFVANSGPDYAQKSVNRRIFPLLCSLNAKIGQTLSRFLQFLARWGQNVALFWECHLFPFSFFEKSTLVVVFKK
jgi:hypothetical protein